MANRILPAKGCLSSGGEFAKGNTAGDHGRFGSCLSFISKL